MTGILISPVARPDIRAFCDEHGAADLRSAWQDYEAALAGLRSGRPSVEQVVRRGQAAFARVLEVGMRPLRPAS